MKRFAVAACSLLLLAGCAAQREATRPAAGEPARAEALAATSRWSFDGRIAVSNGKDGGYNGTWMPSIEVQIIEGGVGDFVPVPGSGLDGNPVPLTYTCNVGRDRDDEVIWKADGPREVFKRGSFKRVNWFGRDPD